MKKSVVVALVLLAFSSTLFAEEDSTLLAKCQGISTVLDLPDKLAFQAMMQQEEIKVKEKYGVNSSEHTALLVKHAFGRGFGNGYYTSLIKEKGMDTALQVFLSFCWADSRTHRADTLARLDFLQKK